MNDETLDDGQEAVEETHEEAAASQAAASSVEQPDYVTKDDLASFADALISRLVPQKQEAEDDDYYGREIEDRVARRLESSLAPILAPIIQQQALSRLGDPAKVGKFVEGLSPEVLDFVAKHKGLSQALQIAANADGSESRRAAPRSEGSYAPDDRAFSQDMAREAEAAFAAFSKVLPNLTAKQVRDYIAGGSK